MAEPRTANDLAEDRTAMAAMRTVMAADRTLMAWVRTALALQSFGFTIYKVLEALQQQGRGLFGEHSPTNIGLFLTAMGTLAIVVGTLEYLQTRKTMVRHHPVPLGRPSFVMAMLMSFMGALLFVGIIARVI